MISICFYHKNLNRNNKKIIQNKVDLFVEIFDWEIYFVFVEVREGLEIVGVIARMFIHHL